MRGYNMPNTDNSYLRTILSKVKGETVSGVKTNNRLLKEIAENISGGSSGGSDDLGTVTLTITYTDQTSETINLAVWESEE